MNILLSGINNYFGEQLKTFFLEQDHKVTCLVRSETLFLQSADNNPNLKIIRSDLIREKYSENLPLDLDVAYYFSNYTAEQGGIYQELELLSLQNYVKKLRRVQCPHLVYVSPLRSPVNEQVKDLLKESYIPYTIVRTSNLIGKSSALMQIFSQMSDKPFIISNSRLAKSRCQPIALSDALIYLDFIASNPIAFNQSYDLCGPDILSYREMLDLYLKLKNIKKNIVTLPYVHLAFSTFWLSKNSGISKATARAFTENIKGDILCGDDCINDLFPHESLTFEEALKESLV